MKKIIMIFVVLLSLPLQANSIKQPKLIIQLVVDQLRGDIIYQNQNKFGEKGFNYLINHGINYVNTHHDHANTTTCAGHATIATGSTPALHGIINNHWYDRKTKQKEYCMADESSYVLKTNHTKRKHPGRSPANISVSTVSDEIVLANKGRSFAVSLKDRGAITLAGHAGKAFWFDKINGGFVTSSWYYRDYPNWVTSWNLRYSPEAIEWRYSLPLRQYTYANAPKFKNRFPEFGNRFPHNTGMPSSPRFFKFFSMTPNADAITADFAKELITKEKLGKLIGKTDYLGISFSVNDAIGHQFGPNSIESEENLLLLDKVLANLFDHIDKQVGLDNALIILTADHGVTNTPVYNKKHHMPIGNPVKIEKLTEKIHHILKNHYNLPNSSLLKIDQPYIYLNNKLIRKEKLNPDKVKRYLAKQLNGFSGLYKAYVLNNAPCLNDIICKKVKKMNYEKRVGDIYLVPEPYRFIGEKNSVRVAHGSPWKYDTYVPLIFAHGNIIPQKIYRKTSTTDIAPTLTAMLNIKMPSGSIGTALSEILNPANK